MPVSVPPTEEETLAVKVTDLPTAEGLALEASVVEVAAGLTDCARVDEVPARKLESPLYFAEMDENRRERSAAWRRQVHGTAERSAAVEERDSARGSAGVSGSDCGGEGYGLAVGRRIGAGVQCGGGGGLRDALGD